ncbi:Polyadenylate-binding protein 2 (Poly(A)-binding protein 2) (Poly(A)-binding protein II) (PABII) (Polyadenylate-binding nuclear protein 1) (Nuclear poly(A)-binding protein 1) (PABP2), putative [Trypanosoma equiperdum]|uniref:Polyadenylate-binding protein n=5 Tax=Trypanozoon TaxID=39700 RepID=Q38DU2_TRYB2|nr:PABP2 [Trypanosoma brucei gambiense DAL972]XP_827358.1 poly(A)-binding protein 1 [Trypanosoma brucei brucei TREU927]AAD13337.1 poly(A) binding protein I [Trypanosoma brucei]RHW70351.1 Polyadenylate-binding protein 2 (Poly(A)-binding protein 2) [Trypanosoma brucei equiperdum]SCU70870.1 Polyadenylate-binding protein 2 (Poly(A)-binding protein 2) (Poly(A)-binding protein II) (PABII) (Polyadenylate-binding nuclear protein 1) (Nuclear poly(A)-binding protein 1) (PABP2), putative [Trypanosoma equi|eukprot:XP_011776823.1 PABP2 [Trypanosoma brucei gambiense DAL972]
MAAFAAASPSIWVGGLDPNLNEQKLYDHFVRVGPVASVRVCVDSVTQKSLGYGYVNFQNPADAEKALDQAGVKLGTKHIRIAKIQRDPSKRRSGVTNIIVKKLPPTVDTYALKEMFSKYGRLTAIGLATDEKGESRGYARISYEKEESAVDAVRELNGVSIDDCAITVERYQPHHREEQLKQYTNLYVKNLDPSVDDEKLKEVFSPFGEVTSAKVRDLAGRPTVGFGYVAYATHEAAAKAVEELDDKESPLAKEGMKLSVCRFRSREERKRERERLRRERQQQHSKYPNLYVKNFDDTVTSERLKALFDPFGETVSVSVMMDKATKVSRCFGFVSFKEQSSAAQAIQELHGSTALGPRPLFVSYALRKDARRQTLEDMRNKQPRMRQPPMGGLMGGMMGPQLSFMNPPAMFNGMHFMNTRMPMMPSTMGMGGPMRPMGPTPMNQVRARPGPQRPPMQSMMAPQQQSHPQIPQPPVAQGQNLSTVLASMTPDQQKNVLGERLYNYIVRNNPSFAAKVTGMLLEMDNSEILNLLDNHSLLDTKVQEALDVLNRHIGM